MTRDNVGPVWRRHLLLVAFLLLVLILLFRNGQWLFSEAYGAFALERVRHHKPDATALSAATYAKQLSPTDANAQALVGRLLVGQRRPNEALIAYRATLRAAPADSSLWQGFAHVKLQLGQYDAELEHALQRARVLAPQVLAIHMDNAYLSMQYWYWVTPAVRSLWLVSLRYVLDHDADHFFKFVLQARKQEVLCREPTLRQLNTKQWCKSALYARKVCFEPFPSQETMKWCRGLGLVQDLLK